MGITSFSNDLLNKYLLGGESICEFGNQTLFFGEYYGKPAKPFLVSKGHKHTSIDINGKDGALNLDLQKVLDIGVFDVVTDFGTSEHIYDIYRCWWNKYNLCRVGGFIISENPEVGSWPLHRSYHYFKTSFYEELVKKNTLRIMELGRHPAMGNTRDGWVIFCVLKKTREGKFMSREDFEELELEFSPSFGREYIR